MNQVFLLGRTTKEPELQYTPSGKAVTNFTLAVNRHMKKDETDFFRIVIWGKTAEYVANYLGKGKKVLIQGRIENRSYESENGDKKYVTEIIGESVEIVEWKENEEEITEEENNGKKKKRKS